MKKIFLYAILSSGFFVSSLVTANETVLGTVKAVKITQKVSVNDCQSNFKQLDYSSLCKVQVLEVKDTDLFLSSSEVVRVSHAESEGKSLKGTLVVNVNGFYLFTFERKDEYGLTKGITVNEATPLMEELVSKTENGEVFWKYYRVMN